MSKKHKSFKSSSYDISIGHGKESASGKTYQRKGIPSECKSSLPIKRKRTYKGICSKLIKTSFYLCSSVTSDKRLRTEDINIDDEYEDNTSETQGTSSEQSLSDND